MLFHWFLMHIHMQTNFIVKNHFYRSMNPACLNFPVVCEYQKYVKEAKKSLMLLP